jgi:hypothetical protein
VKGISIMAQVFAPDKTQISSPVDRKIEVLDLHPVRQGSIRAYCRLRLGTLVIAGVKVVQQAGQRAYARLTDWQDQATREWFPIVSCLSPSLESGIECAVLAAYNEAQ